MQKVKSFIKNEAVLLLSFLLAAASAFAVKPCAQYAEYIDFRTLALLFCLMAITASLCGLGVFRLLAVKLLGRVSTVRGLGTVLCLLCFFSSMLITNDVALITFVPFSLTALRMAGRREKAVYLITLETVAANLGSMLTPIGNPQNLYLFSEFNMGAADFFLTVLPYAALSLALTVAMAQFAGGDKLTCVAEEAPPPDIRRCAVCAVLFLAALLTVFRVLPFAATLCVTLAAMLAFDRKALTRVDYSLLLTFVFLFVFIGNLGKIAPVSEFLRSAVTGREVPVGVLASQVFSNVPAAILLSGFTQNARALLVGVNLGGLGTLIASMASLISFKFIAKEGHGTGKYILTFTLVNALFLALNLALWAIIK